MKKFLSIILAILMIAATLPFAFAAESDGVKTTLDVSKGNIVIADSYVTWGSETVNVDPDGYIITGSAKGNTPLKFINDSGSPITFDLVFDNLSITASTWCSVMAIEDYSPVTLNIVSEGSNTVSSYNHPCFNNTIARTSITINITKTEGSSIYFERREEPENGILFDQNDSNTVVYINGYQLDKSAGCYDDAHKNLDGIQTCKGYECDVCGQYFGEKDETKHYGNGIHTCKGYKCDFCDVWYGEANGVHIDENLDNLCDNCDAFIGEEIKVGDTYTVKNRVYIKFVPSVSGTYILSSSSDSQNPYVELYDSDMKAIADAQDNYYDDFMRDYDFTLVHEYSAGETYYFLFNDYHAVYNYSVIFECGGHVAIDEAVKENEVAPGCGVSGSYDLVVYCGVCGEELDRDTVDVNALTHSFTNYVVTEAAECEKAGWEAAVCDHGCAATDEREIQPLGHTECEVYSAASDCHYKNCIRCDYVFENTREAHQFTEEIIIKEATETESGLKRVICTICGVGYEKEIPAEGTTDPAPDEPADNTCDHICHSNNAFVQFIWKIISFFFRLFNIQQYCDCGVIHYDAPVFG